MASISTHHAIQEEPPTAMVGKAKQETFRRLSASTSKQGRSVQRNFKAHKYEKYFDFIDPIMSLHKGLYKYKDEADRKILQILNKKLIGQFGEGSKFKDESSVLKYVYLIEDGETLSSIKISQEDLYDPNEKKSEEEMLEELEAGFNSPDDIRKLTKDRSNIGVVNLNGNMKAPNLEYTCKVCMDNAVSVTFIPCGHLVVCGACAPALGDCPVCRQTVKGTIATKF